MKSQSDQSLLSVQAYNVLEQKIVDLELEPGSFVTESDLAKLTGFGRMPIKDALKTLESIKLVQIYPRKGIIISPIEWGAIFQQKELYRALKLIQYKCVARNMTLLERDILITIKQKIKDLDKNDVISYRKIVGEEFYNFAVQASHNPYLTQMIQPLRIHQKRTFNKYYHTIIKSFVAVTEIRYTLIDLILEKDLEGIERIANVLFDDSDKQYKNLYYTEND